MDLSGLSLARGLVTCNINTTGYTLIRRGAYYCGDMFDYYGGWVIYLFI